MMGKYYLISDHFNKLYRQSNLYFLWFSILVKFMYAFLMKKNPTCFVTWITRYGTMYFTPSPNYSLTEIRSSSLNADTVTSQIPAWGRGSMTLPLSFYFQGLSWIYWVLFKTTTRFLARLLLCIPYWLPAMYSPGSKIMKLISLQSKFVQMHGHFSHNNKTYSLP